MPSDLTVARLRRAAAASLCALLVAGGCANDEDEAAPAPSATAASAETSPSPSAQASFPLTMEHRFGETVIPSKPQRVVAAGFTDQDFALALGVVPVGVRDFIGPYAEEERPWAADLVEGEEIELVGGEELNLEAVAALDPDLILYYSYAEEDVYDKLAQIAPTLVEPRAGTLWQQQTLDIGKALGEPAKAEELVAEVEAQFAAAVEDNPQFEGAAAAIQFGDASTPGYYLLEPTDPRFGFFDSLGFEPVDTTGEISPEQADLLDQGDVLVVVGAEESAFADRPEFQRVDGVTEDRVAYLGGFDGDFAGALGFGSPLSLPYAIDLAVEKLAEARRR